MVISIPLLSANPFDDSGAWIVNFLARKIDDI